MAIYYFPSCKVSSTYCKASKRLTDYIYNRFHIEPVGCCRVNYRKLTEDDIAIVTCNNCAKILEENSKATIRFAWEIIDEDEEFIYKKYNDIVTVADCWITKENTHEHETIRSLLRKMNITYLESKDYVDSIHCGILLGSCNPDNVRLASKTYHDPSIFKNLSSEKQIQYMKNHCKTIPTDKVICTCRSCANSYKIADKKGIHILELLFPD